MLGPIVNKIIKERGVMDVKDTIEPSFKSG